MLPFSVFQFKHWKTENERTGKNLTDLLCQASISMVECSCNLYSNHPSSLKPRILSTNESSPLRDLWMVVVLEDGGC